LRHGIAVRSRFRSIGGGQEVDQIRGPLVVLLAFVNLAGSGNHGLWVSDEFANAFGFPGEAGIAQGRGGVIEAKAPSRPVQFAT
jgi:hypothetical protein